MSVIQDDYTFSISTHSSYQYGTSASCDYFNDPLGEIKVNLTGTGFYLDPFVS